MPYTLELNDISAFLNYKLSGEEFGKVIRDQFDMLFEEDAKTGRVMAIALHPFLTGHPHRAKYLEQALKHIAGHDQVWIARGAEIVDWYKRNFPLV